MLGTHYRIIRLIPPFRLWSAKPRFFDGSNDLFCQIIQGVGYVKILKNRANYDSQLGARLTGNHNRSHGSKSVSEMDFQNGGVYLTLQHVQ